MRGIADKLRVRAASPADESGGTKTEPTARGNVSSDDTSGARLEPRRVLVGGFTILFAVAGYLAVRVAVAATGLSQELELAALPAFGVAGVVGFVVLVAGVVPPEERPSEGE